MGMERLEMYSKFPFVCQGCGLKLHNDPGGWYTGDTEQPIWNCSGFEHGQHIPRRLSGDEESE